MEIKNIVFDLGGVVLKGTPRDTIEKFCDIEEHKKELQRFFNSWGVLDKGNSTLQEKLGVCNFSPEIKELYAEKLLHFYEVRDYNDDLLALFKVLKQNNKNIYILSDNIWEVYKYLKILPIFKYVDGWVVSCEYHTVKKDEYLFDILLDKYNLDPETCYFIDNKLLNIQIAEKHRMVGYLFDENEDINKLYDDMKKHKIL